jgi:hypothetical protein
MNIALIRLVVFFSEIAGKEIADHGVTLLKEMKQNPASPSLNMQDELGDGMHRLTDAGSGFIRLLLASGGKERA